MNTRIAKAISYTKGDYARQKPEYKLQTGIFRSILEAALEGRYSEYFPSLDEEDILWLKNLGYWVKKEEGCSCFCLHCGCAEKWEVSW